MTSVKKVKTSEDAITAKKHQKYVVRCDRAGVFFGCIKKRDGNEVTMTKVRKLWYWDGAAAVEELAVNGTKKPGECKFTVEVAEMVVFNPVQILPCTDKATKSLEAVDEWRA